MFRPLAPLLGCVFVVMIGYGIALTVLPAYTERVHGLAGDSGGLIAFHLGVLTSLYALAQFLTGPVVGRLGDRFGRRPLILVGLAGSGVTQAAFAFTRSLPWLYALRVAGGLAASLLTVGVAAAIADQTSEATHGQGMAWFGTAVSLGVVAGPVLGGVLGQVGVGATTGIHLDGFTLPFLAAGGFAVVALVVAFFTVPESLDRSALTPRGAPRPRRSTAMSALLGLVVGGQFGLAIFEGTFVLYARDRFAFEPTETAAAFVVCGAVMGVLQGAVVVPLTRLVRSGLQAAAGFMIMGVATGALIMVQSFPSVLAAIAGLASGTALVVPNLAGLVATHNRERFGRAMGLKSSATSLGQFLGPLVGGAMFAWHQISPYLLGAVTLMALGVAMAGFDRWSVAHASQHSPTAPSVALAAFEGSG